MFLTREMPLPYYLRIDIFDTNKGTYLPLECKDSVKQMP